MSPIHGQVLQLSCTDLVQGGSRTDSPFATMKTCTSWQRTHTIEIVRRSSSSRIAQLRSFSILSTPCLRCSGMMHLRLCDLSAMYLRAISRCLGIAAVEEADLEEADRVEQRYYVWCCRRQSAPPRRPSHLRTGRPVWAGAAQSSRLSRSVPPRIIVPCPSSPGPSSPFLSSARLNE